MISPEIIEKNRNRIKEKLAKEKADKEATVEKKLDDERLATEKADGAKEKEDFAVRIAEEIKGVISKEMAVIVERIEKIKIDTPEIPEVIIPEIVIPDINIPDIKLPEIKVPEIKIPKINSPVIPEIVIPKIEIPEMPEIPIDEIVKAINEGVKKSLKESPLSVIPVDKKGNLFKGSHTEVIRGGGGINQNEMSDALRLSKLATEDKQDDIKTAIDNKELKGNTLADGSGDSYNIVTDSSGRLHTRSFKNAAGEGRRMLVDSDRHGQVDVLSVPAGAAKEAKQLANNHQVTVSNLEQDWMDLIEFYLEKIELYTDRIIAAPATSAKQLLNNHQVTVSNPTTNPETGLAKEAKQLADGHKVNIEGLDAPVTTILNLMIANTQYKLPASELANRKLLVIYNKSSADIYIGSSSVTTTTGIKLEAGGIMNIDCEKDLYAVCGTGFKIINLLELS